MPSQNSNISVVILTRNSARTLESCLRSLILEKPGEIIAVDMLSTDATLSILRRYNARILTDAYGSLAGSRNMGVKAAKYNLVMFTDSDVELSEGCLAKLRLDLERNGWGGVQALIRSSENVSYWQRSMDEYFSAWSSVGPTKHICTAATLFRKDILVKFPFDEDFRESFEDSELCLRLVANMHRLGRSTAVAYHHHRRDLSGFVRQSFRSGLGRARLGLKYRSVRVLVVLDVTFSEIIFSVVSGRARLVPFFIVKGVAIFVGVVVGVSRLHHSFKSKEL